LPKVLTNRCRFFCSFLAENSALCIAGYNSAALAKGMESIESTASSCFQTEDGIIQSLKKEVEREDTTFEQKQFYYEKMEAAAIRKESKETEHRDTILTILRYGGEALLFGLGFCACLFLGKANLKIPIRS
jgi:hypothetical protein